MNYKKSDTYETLLDTTNCLNIKLLSCWKRHNSPLSKQSNSEIGTVDKCIDIPSI